MPVHPLEYPCMHTCVPIRIPLYAYMCTHQNIIVCMLVHPSEYHYIHACATIRIPLYACLCTHQNTIVCMPVHPSEYPYMHACAPIRISLNACLCTHQNVPVCMPVHPTECPCIHACAPMIILLYACMCTHQNILLCTSVHRSEYPCKHACPHSVIIPWVVRTPQSESSCKHTCTPIRISWCAILCAPSLSMVHTDRCIIFASAHLLVWSASWRSNFPDESPALIIVSVMYVYRVMTTGTFLLISLTWWTILWHVQTNHVLFYIKIIISTIFIQAFWHWS